MIYWNKQLILRKFIINLMKTPQKTLHNKFRDVTLITLREVFNFNCFNIAAVLLQWYHFRNYIKRYTRNGL